MTFEEYVEMFDADQVSLAYASATLSFVIKELREHAWNAAIEEAIHKIHAIWEENADKEYKPGEGQYVYGLLDAIKVVKALKAK